MTINPIASSSQANAYIMNDSRTPLLIEAGVRFRDLQKATGFRLSSFGGCLISHSHQDHSRAVPDLVKAGIDCYMTAETAKSIGVDGHRVKIIEPLKQFAVGGWKILPFPTQHDCPGSVGFLLTCRDEKILFATDTSYLRYRFYGVTRLMIEANYMKEVLDENVKNGDVDLARKRRLLRSHFSLENLVEMLKANNWSKLKECWLLHLSKGNSHEGYVKRTVQSVLGVPVRVCEE